MDSAMKIFVFYQDVDLLPNDESGRYQPVSSCATMDRVIESMMDDEDIVVCFAPDAYLNKDFEYIVDEIYRYKKMLWEIRGESGDDIHEQFKATVLDEFGHVCPQSFFDNLY